MNASLLSPFDQGVAIRMAEVALYLVCAWGLSALSRYGFFLFVFLFIIGVVMRHAEASPFVSSGANWIVRDPLFWAAKRFDFANCDSCGTSVFDGRAPTGYASHGAEEHYWPHAQCQNCGADLKQRQASAG